MIFFFGFVQGHIMTRNLTFLGLTSQAWSWFIKQKFTYHLSTHTQELKLQVYYNKMFKQMSNLTVIVKVRKTKENID